MENLEFYNRFRACPEDAKRPIVGGKLKGKTDINPMWRIKVLTEAFGPQGIGWKIANVRFWDKDAPSGECMVFCSLDLMYKQSGEWSSPVPGFGGSGLIQLEKGNLVANDEAYKMAYTDAISVAAKGLGVAADVYWAADRTKYTKNEDQSSQEAARPQSKPQAKKEPMKQTERAANEQHRASAVVCVNCKRPIIGVVKGGKQIQAQEVAKSCGGLCIECYRQRKAQQKPAQPTVQVTGERGSNA